MPTVATSGMCSMMSAVRFGSGCAPSFGRPNCSNGTYESIITLVPPASFSP